MEITKIEALRENLTLPINGKDETWTYLTIYDQNKNILARSSHHHPESDIIVNYYNLDFVSLPHHQVMIPLISLVKFVNEPLP